MLLKKLKIASRTVNETWLGDVGGSSDRPRNRHSWLRQLSYSFQPLRQLGRIKCCSDNGSQFKMSFVPNVVSIPLTFSRRKDGYSNLLVAK